MVKRCRYEWCHADFEVHDKDIEFLKKFGVPADFDACPFCRHQHRLMFNPTVNFYRRTSSLSGRPIITVFSPQKQFPVYAIDEWFSDSWNGIAYGREFDFSRPFFEQYQDLQSTVPKMANANINSINCDFSYSASNSKNIYYSRTVARSEDVFYSEYITGYNQNLCDCLRCFRSSGLYQCVQCLDCHLSSYLFQCNNTRDSHFCFDLQGCHDCLFCTNLRNKSYHVFNLPVSRESFHKVRDEYLDGRYSTTQKNLLQLESICRDAVCKQLSNTSCEDCVGDRLTNCSECFECYDCINGQDCRYCWLLAPSEKAVTLMDVSSGGVGELIYNCSSVGFVNYMLRMCVHIRQSNYLTYCTDCFSCKNCFGCAGLKNAQYCILNKQYSQEQYEGLVAKIIDHMEKTDEWGCFFPPHLSPVAYNQSQAMSYFPLDADTVKKRGWQWEDAPELETDTTEDNFSWPDSIEDVPQEFCNRVLRCEKTGKKYKVQQQELLFYKTMKQPIPHVHPDVRIKRRQSMLNGNRMFARACNKCGSSMETTYSSVQTEKVYCESCYLEALY